LHRPGEAPAASANAFRKFAAAISLSQQPTPPRAGLRTPENCRSVRSVFGSTLGLARVRAWAPQRGCRVGDPARTATGCARKTSLPTLRFRRPDRRSAPHGPRRGGLLAVGRPGPNFRKALPLGPARERALGRGPHGGTRPGVPFPAQRAAAVPNAAVLRAPHCGRRRASRQAEIGSRRNATTRSPPAALGSDGGCRLRVHDSESRSFI